MKKNYYQIFDTIPSLKPKLSQQFHQSTQIDAYPKKPDKWPVEWKKIYYKGYPRFSAIQLPKAEKIIKPFDQTLRDRCSTREFSDKPITANELGTLLYYSAGENKNRHQNTVTYRYYASGGARYPLEVYPIIRNSKDVANGSYHYYVKKHLLERLPGERISDSFIDNSFGQPYWKDAAAFLAISAVFYRTQVKYFERGYRLVLMELGHMSQNIYLTCAAMGIGCCEINGYNDDKFNDVLDLDGWRECVTIVFAIGHLKK